MIKFRLRFFWQVAKDTQGELVCLLADLAAQPFSIALLLADVEEVAGLGVTEMRSHAIALKGASTMNATAASRELKQRRT